jgi:carbon-monoxide dehydrogenase medium subunit
MKPPPFRYYDPTTLKEAVQLLATLENAKLLAGGQSLMPMLNMRFLQPDHVVDLNRVTGLGGIEVKGGAIAIGAMTRQRDIEYDDGIKAQCPLMHEALQEVGHRQTRNRGTIGGSLCHLDPSAELVTIAAALDATVTVEGPKGGREIAFADFPAGYMNPAIEPDEIVTGVRLPIWKKGHGAAFIEYARRHGDFALASAAALVELDGKGHIARTSLTLGGVAVAPVRMRDVEKRLEGESPTPKRFAELAEACRSIDALEDVHAPSSYRQHLAAVLARRALETAASRATAVH